MYVSTDGTNWSQVLQVSGPNKQWTAQACDLGAYIGQKIQLRFYFDTIDPLYNNFRGWYVDDIRVSVVSSGVLFLDAFANGLTNWTRVAGAANWDVTNNALRAWRIGNNDNILSAGNMSWSNYSVQASILYNKQGPYFSDADLLLRYQDRYNYYKVGIRNFYGAWRLRYEVDEQGVVTSQGWLYLFSKTNQPVEGAWYNLKADVQGTNVNVFFNGDPAGSFVITNFLSGKIAIGTMAEQLGIWEPPQGYFFIDDDETGMTGSPLNMDWGYLQQFFNTVIFPSVFAMNDTEVANLLTWVNAGTYSLISMDGGLGMVDEGGTNKIGRTAGLFGVAPNLTTISGLNKATIGTNDHYVTLDYAPGAQITAAGTATAWSAPTNSSIVLGTLDNGTASVPALICSKIGSDPNSPTKAFCFNFAVDTQGQLTNAFHTIAQRVFEWTRGEAYKVLLQLKYPNPAGVNFDFVVAQVTGWVLDGNGTNNLIVNLPTDGIMTGDNLYWSMYVYPWDSTYPWGDHAGFYSSANDGFNVSIPGQGLEIFGGVDPAWGGRGWSLWAGYNTRGSNAVIEFGVKAQGSITNEDNFDDGNYTGWTISPSPNISWSVANGALRATVVGTGGYAYITRDGVNVSNQHITLEYDVRFTDAATNGGIVYRGAVMYVNPALCGWADLNPNYTNYAGLAIGAWHHVVINIRDGDPYWTSDLYVDAQPVFLSEPIEVTNFTSSSVGFLSPYYGGYTEWDNFRVADEQYSLVYQSVNGEVIPTNSDGTLFPYLPDYDPAWWEHEGTALGAQYEWYVYFRSGSMHAYTSTHVYFAPRLMVESPAFPTYMNPGDTVSVPIEWENLQSLPVNMQLHLEDPYVGTAYVNQIFMLTNSWGTNSFTVTIPTNLPAHSNYLWVAYTYPTNLTGTDAFNGRIGLDDTFRFTPDGKPFMPETRVTISSLSSGGDTFGVYSDAGIPLATQILTWQGGTASFNGDYLGETPPEGVKCFQTIGNYWQGWGVFAASAPADMSAFANGFLKFWVKNSVQLTLNIEDWDGAKTTVYIANSTNNWRQVTVPLTMLAGVNFSRIKGYFEITALSATTFYIDNVQWIKGVYHVYHDAGIPSGANISTWGDPNAAFNANFSGQSPPEGGKCFYTQTTNSAGWGVNFPTNTVDMHLYSNALLRFWAKSTEPLTIGIEGPPGTVVNRQIPSTGDAWYQFALPLTNFTGINFTQVRSLFNVTVTNAATFYIDDVRWECTTNLVVGPPALSLYSDAGIPTNTGVLVWWASQYWGQVSGPYNNGDFETAPQTNWTLSVSGGSATGQYVAAAAHNGSVGLRERNGTDTGSTWCITYQTLTAWAGDVFNGGAWIRQPAGNGWPAGSVAFAQLRFLDFGGVTITSYVSSVQVTNSGQGWTYCGTADVTAPPQARSLRLELVVQKPAGVSGESVADFDDAAVNQANSFNGDFADDPTTPEGIKCFRSYCVAWSGWGIFYTNGVTDLSAYTNGYLNFWYKSSGYTKVEIQSIQGGVTNTAQGAFFGPTTNQNGEIAWTYQSIPITNFVGVSLSNIKSPFMLTDPNYDRAFYVDDVKWVLGP